MEANNNQEKDVVCTFPPNAHVYSLDEELAIKYLKDRQEDTGKLLKEIKETQGNLGYASVRRFSHDSNAVLVNGEWNDSLICALAYILATWW